MSEFNTPWRVELSEAKPGIVGDDGYLIAEAFSSNVSAHIVLCVNAHQGLVDALKTTTEALQRDADPAFAHIILANQTVLAAAGVKL